MVSSRLSSSRQLQLGVPCVAGNVPRSRPCRGPACSPHLPTTARTTASFSRCPQLPCIAIPTTPHPSSSSSSLACRSSVSRYRSESASISQLRTRNTYGLAQRPSRPHSQETSSTSARSRPQRRVCRKTGPPSSCLSCLPLPLTSSAASPSVVISCKAARVLAIVGWLVMNGCAGVRRATWTDGLRPRQLLSPGCRGELYIHVPAPPRGFTSAVRTPKRPTQQWGLGKHHSFGHVAVSRCLGATSLLLSRPLLDMLLQSHTQNHLTGSGRKGT